MAALGLKQKRCILRGVASSSHCLPRCRRASGGGGGEGEVVGEAGCLALMSSQISFSLLRLRRATTENEFIMRRRNCGQVCVREKLSRGGGAMAGGAGKRYAYVSCLKQS